MTAIVTNRARQSVLRQVAALPSLSTHELIERWRDLFGTEPQPYNKKFLVKRLAYRIQELAYGGINDELRKNLDAHLNEARYDISGLPTMNNVQDPGAYKQYTAGTILRREWRGDIYEVTVVRRGFEFGGRIYRHLTPIAKIITGTHQSGNAFFGLKPIKKGTAQP